jgi:hypothetical protein
VITGTASRVKIYAAGQASFAPWVRLAKMLVLAPSALKSLSFQQMALFRQNGGRRW